MAHDIPNMRLLSHSMLNGYPNIGQGKAIHTPAAGPPPPSWTVFSAPASAGPPGTPKPELSGRSTDASGPCSRSIHRPE